MFIFLLSTLLLITGYACYGVIIEKIIGLNPDVKTPALTMNDGVDYIPLKPRKIFLIQFLNIAGLGPVFGALLGAVYGPICLIWIVFGSIFAGAVHDMLSGVISLKNKGGTMTFFVKKYLGNVFYTIFLILVTLLLILVGSIFAQTPARLLASMTNLPFTLLLFIIFGYYFLATLLPIDKIIGRFYPFFGGALILSTLLLVSVLFFKGLDFYPDLQTLNQNPQKTPIFPLMFITIACGALSGFHATQSPMMARCITNEKYCRPVFYGAMILEGFIALIWATLGIAFYHGSKGLANAINSNGNPGAVVSEIATSFLGKWGGILAILSVIFLAITTGDTALRSARLTCADILKLDQKNLGKRLGLTFLILLSAIVLAFIDVNKIWVYFGWANQLLATVMLWVGVFYLKEKNRNIWIALIPAVFITFVCSTYLGYAENLLNLKLNHAVGLGLFLTTGTIIGFFCYKKGATKE